MFHYRRIGRMGVILTMASLLVAAPAAARQPAGQKAIEAALGASADGWNHADLDRFMAVYENAPATSYVNGHGLVRGFAAIRAMYGIRFKDAATMGKLSLAVVEYRKLGRDYALVIGHFTLQRATAATGIFTLIFHKSAAGWGIISDHTS